MEDLAWEVCPAENKPKDKRLEKIEEVQAKNSKLSATDAARQAVYFLGLSQDS